MVEKADAVDACLAQVWQRHTAVEQKRIVSHKKCNQRAYIGKTGRSNA